MQMYVLKRVYHGYIKLEWYFLMQGFILIDSSRAFLDCIMVTSPYFIDIFLTFLSSSDRIYVGTVMAAKYIWFFFKLS